ncbi:50S ribosomal protein L28 [Patescibacteria group bacterium]|nr:50S ribosomal protein L28 [Patescibacteria group bacterium]
MAKVCEICGRGALSGQSRSHSRVATKKKQNVNLQKTLLNNKRVKACARCIRSQSKLAMV